MSEWAQFINKLESCLCPPGDEIYTVNTGKDKKNNLQNKLYRKSGEDVRTQWKKSLEGLSLGPSTVLLGIASDCGGGILRGANWGPLFIREQMLQENPRLSMIDMGDVRVVPHFLRDEMLSAEQIKKSREALYQDPHSPFPVSPLSITESVVQSFYQVLPHKKIFALGGDHSISYPLISEYIRFKKSLNKRVAVIHFDAHTDMLEHRLGVDICFGSWTSHILNQLTSPQHLIQIGIRSTSKDQDYWEKKYGLKQFWAKDVEKSPNKICDQIVAHLKHEKIDELYVTFDIDSLDSEYVMATGTPEPQGLAPHSAMLILQALYENFPITGADLVEVAPYVYFSQSKYATLEPESTLMLASQFSQFFIEAMNNPQS